MAVKASSAGVVMLSWVCRFKAFTSRSEMARVKSRRMWVGILALASSGVANIRVLTRIMAYIQLGFISKVICMGWCLLVVLRSRLVGLASSGP